MESPDRSTNNETGIMTGDDDDNNYNNTNNINNNNNYVVFVDCVGQHSKLLLVWQHTGAEELLQKYTLTG